MAYEHLYQGRRKPAPMPDPEPQRLHGESFVDFMRRVHPPQIDASSGLSEREREQVREIKRLIADGSWGIGNVIPNRLMAAVFDGAPRQGQPFTLEAASDPARSIAAKVDACVSLHASLATDAAPQRGLASDAPRRPTMSYKLAQVMGDYQYMDEVSLEESMAYWKITEPRDRVSIKNEAMQLGLMRGHGSPIPTPRPHEPRKYHPAPSISDPRSQHFVPSDSKEAQRRTSGQLKTMHAATVPAPPPRRTGGMTLQACTADGFAAYDGTSISFDDDAGLNTL